MGTPPSSTLRTTARHLLLAWSAVVALAACKPSLPDAPPVPSELPGAASEPATAVRVLASRLRENDLSGFARAAVPAAEYARLETAWRENGSRWPLTLLPLDEQLLPLLQTLSAEGAETRLKQAYDRNLAHQQRDLRDAARNLGFFGIKYVSGRDDYTDSERKHYVQIIEALADWGQHAPLGDPQRAHAAIERLCAAARKTGVDDDDDLRDAGMEASLQRLAPFLGELKSLLATSYGLTLDESLGQLRSGLLAEHGEHAQVQVRYPFAGKQIDTVVDLEKRHDRWYLAGYLRDAEQMLAQVDALATDAASPVEEQAATP